MTHHDHSHAEGGATPKYEAKVLTVSDSVVLGNRDDTSGPAVVEYLESHGIKVVDERVCADGSETVSNQLSSMAYNFWGLIVTAGGTGFGPRDLTPEGTVRILDRRAYGFSEAMRATDPKGRLSRGVSGTRGKALILNVAGSPSASKPMLDAVIDVIPHALDLMAGEQPH